MSQHLVTVRVDMVDGTSIETVQEFYSGNPAFHHAEAATAADIATAKAVNAVRAIYNRKESTR